MLPVSFLLKGNSLIFKSKIGVLLFGDRSIDDSDDGSGKQYVMQGIMTLKIYKICFNINKICLARHFIYGYLEVFAYICMIKSFTK